MISVQPSACPYQPISAVDDKSHAVNIARGLGNQETVLRSRYRRSARPSGIFRAIFSFTASGKRRFIPSVSSIGPGADAVDADAVASPFDRQISRDRIDTGLCGGNMDLHWCRQIMEGRRNIKDLALRTFKLVEGGPANIESAFCIDIYDRPETVGRKLVGSERKFPAAPLTTMSSFHNARSFLRSHSGLLQNREHRP